MSQARTRKDGRAEVRINKEIKADLKKKGHTAQTIVDKFIKKFVKKDQK